MKWKNCISLAGAVRFPDLLIAARCLALRKLAHVVHLLSSAPIRANATETRKKEGKKSKSLLLHLVPIVNGSKGINTQAVTPFVPKQ